MFLVDESDVSKTSKNDVKSDVSKTTTSKMNGDMSTFKKSVDTYSYFHFQIKKNLAIDSKGFFRLVPLQGQGIAL